MDYKYYRQVQPERGIQGNFASGQLDFRWKTEDNSSFIPSKSYFVIKFKLTDGLGGRINKEFGVAPNLNCCDNLFQQMDLRVNGKSVSKWNDYVAQCAALKTRLGRSMTKRQALMSSCNYTKIDLVDRLSQISSNGIQEKDVVWRRGAILAANAASGRTLDFLDLATPNTVEFVVANNQIIFRSAGGVEIPDMSKHFAVGDYIYFNDGGEKALLVTGYLTTDKHNDTLTVSGAVLAVGPGNLVAQVRIHDTYYQDRLYSNHDQANDIELIWTPPLGFFDINREVCGDYKLELTPHPEGVWQKYAVEGILNRAVGLTANDFKIVIGEMNLYLCVHVHPGPITNTETFTFSDIECSSQNLTTNSLTSTIFNIHPKNHSLTLAFQDSAVGDDIRLSRSKFKIVDDQELNLVRYYIQMDGITLPDPIPSLEMKQDIGVNHYQQRYYENIQYSGGYETLEQLESMEEWKRAGIYFHYRWGVGYKRSGQAMIYTNFSSAFKGETEAINRNPQILLFDHYYTTVHMNVQQGELIDIEVS